MIIDPAQYTELVEEVRLLKAMNDALVFQNESLQNKFINEKSEKEQLFKQLTQFRQKIQLQHQQLLQNSQQQVRTITEELEKKKQNEIAFFEKKVVQLQKGTYQKLKSLQIEFKDHRLKSHLNDEFVSRLLKLYPAQHNPGLPQLFSWIKKLTLQKPKKEELSVFTQSQKQNKRISSKLLLKQSSKKKFLEVSK